MDWRYTTIIAVLVGAAGYVVGYDRGQDDCPEMARYQADQDAAFEDEMAALNAEFSAMPSGREAICDRIFDMVTDGLDQEALDEQAERARMPDP